MAPGIRRLQLPIDFPGLGHVNTYALEDKDGFALVDPGMPGEASWKMLLSRMDAAEIPLRHVHTVVVTHSHPDHFGGAGMLAEEAGARVVSSTLFKTPWDPTDLDDRELEARDPAGGEADDDVRLPNFQRPTPWGGLTEGPPPERIAEMRAHWHDYMKWFRAPQPTHRLDDADHLTLAGREWVALHTPGHTEDHLCLFDPTEGVLLSGDHVLPTITPHISGMVEGDPLRLFFDSLDRVAELPGVTTVLPAHGLTFADLAGRVTAIKEHHDERLERLLEIADETGWASVADLSHHLFQPRSWGSMAESETYAHLEHLRLRGQAERREEAGLLLYRA